jgi:hypothetical protein
MSNNVKVIHLDDEDFSVESDSDESSPDLGTITTAQAPPPTTTTTATDSAVPPEEGGAADSTDADSECNTADLLASDPLYFILSKFFITEDGKSLVTVLDEINKKLDKLS